MKTFSFSAATMLVLAGSALGAKNPEQPVLWANSPERPSASVDRTAPDILPFDVTGIQSWDAPGSGFNTVIFLNVQPFATVNGLGWDVNLTAIAPSWRSELAVLVTDSTGLGGFNLAPGVDNSPGGPTNYNSAGGIVKLANYAIPDVVALADGLIRLEFFESYDDGAGIQDGVWNSGSLFFQGTGLIIPAPSAVGLLGLAGVGLLGRKRR